MRGPGPGGPGGPHGGQHGGPHGGHHGGPGGPRGGFHGGNHMPPPPHRHYRPYGRYGGGCLGCCMYLLGAVCVIGMLIAMIF